MEPKQDKPGELRHTRRLTTILVADICGYSKMSERDQDHAIRTSDLLYKIFETTTERHGGRVFNRIADGFLAEFPSARSGMLAALDYCKEIKARNNLAPNAIEAEVRAGIHVGDVTDRPDGDILGHGVNIAARLQEQAAPGMILTSSNIVNLLGPAFPHKGTKMGALALKNISEAVTAYQIDPEKSAGRFSFRIPKILKSKALLYTAVLGVVFYGAMTLQGERAEAMLHKKIEQVMELNFNNENITVNSTVSGAYFRGVVETLSISEIPSHQVSFALLESGDVGQAILILENSLQNIDFDSQEYIDTLHQIAALSYHHDSAKSVGYYETIRQLRPNDEAAMFQLVRAYHIRLEAEKAIKLSKKILDLEIGTSFQKAKLKIDIAFNRILALDFKSSIEMFEEIRPEVEAVRSERLFNEWRFLYGYALARDGNLNKGEQLVLASIHELERLGTDTNLPRAYSALGIINKMRADRTPSRKKTYLLAALKFFDNQFERGKEIDKKREMAEALYSMGEIYFELDQPNDAHQKFVESLKLSRSHNYPTSERRARMGLAALAKQQGNQELVCEEVDRIVEIYQNNTSIKLTEKTITTLLEFGCGIEEAKLKALPQ